MGHNKYIRGGLVCIGDFDYGEKKKKKTCDWQEKQPQNLQKEILSQKGQAQKGFDL